ncbi:hypothetical protein QA641_14475 [Bradyrhizobium sp. CB1650]|uniref:hypothetical protein n=1 Tax=Bradyrhizobium sp. CB1650 TaxID=3039153 RepID=UPI002434FA89|nr:hypothetical protein [Bradyrhizobium sp. CB1650]WGD55006.1 hypothetical protein QA641_14475 [Bradyrhizobium sp. CB1650]
MNGWVVDVRFCRGASKSSRKRSGISKSLSQYSSRRWNPATRESGFVRRLGDLLGIGVYRFDGGGSTDGLGFGVTPRGWSFTRARHADVRDAELDLSWISHIATANSTDPLPAQLKDRYRVTNVSGPQLVDLPAPARDCR